MKYTKIISALFVSVLLTTGVLAQTTNAPVAATDNGIGQWTLSLDGSGVTTIPDGPSQSAFGFNLAVGRTFCVNLPLVNCVNFYSGVRQGFSYVSSPSSTTLFNTRGYLDVTLLTYKNFELDAGANIGAYYGNTPLTWVVSPEVVTKYWLSKNTAVYGRVEFPFNISNNEWNNALQYGLGIEVKF